MVYFLLWRSNHPFYGPIDYRERKSLLSILPCPSDLGINKRLGNLDNDTSHLGLGCESSSHSSTTLLVDCLLLCRTCLRSILRIPTSIPSETQVLLCGFPPPVCSPTDGCWKSDDLILYMSLGLSGL